MSPARLPVFDYDQVLPLGFRFPARMSVLPLEAGQVALLSPIPIDDAMAQAIARHGQVAFLIAPNLLHHLYLEAALRRYPEARVVAPGGLREKKPQVQLHAALDLAQPEPALPPELAAAVDVIPLRGMPGLDELAVFHRGTRALVLTDLVFNITRPRGWLAHLVLFLVGCHGRLGSSRALRALVKDRAAARASAERLLQLPFESLVVAHGDVIEHDARARLARALDWLLPAREAPALAATGSPR